MTRIAAARALVLRSVTACKWLVQRYPDPAALKDRLNNMDSMFKALREAGMRARDIAAGIDGAKTKPGFTGASDKDVRLVYEAVQC